MTRLELVGFHREMCEDARGIMDRKNTDYASADDPFHNFRRHGLEGIAVRISDKLARLESFIKNGELVVAEETVQDTCIDLLNYAVLFSAFATEKRDA